MLTNISFVKAELFETYSEYVITKPQLCDKIITFAVEDETQKHLWMGIPQCIEGSQYDRNALLFNIVLVFEMKSSTQTCTK